MTVFIPYDDAIEVAKCLDARRLNRQIQECGWIINAASSEMSYRTKTHPCYKMWKDHTEWLKWYQKVLKTWSKTHNPDLLYELRNSEPKRPEFLSEDVCNASKCQLYHKFPEHYKEFAPFKDFTDSNWYVINGEIIKYKQR